MNDSGIRNGAVKVLPHGDVLNMVTWCATAHGASVSPRFKSRHFGSEQQFLAGEAVALAAAIQEAAKQATEAWSFLVKRASGPAIVIGQCPDCWGINKHASNCPTHPNLAGDGLD